VRHVVSRGRLYVFLDYHHNQPMKKNYDEAENVVDQVTVIFLAQCQLYS
jgi:hypothetical protein